MSVFIPYGLIGVGQTGRGDGRTFRRVNDIAERIGIACDDVGLVGFGDIGAVGHFIRFDQVAAAFVVAGDDLAVR